MGKATPDEIANTQKIPKITAQADLVNCESWENCNSNPQIKFALEGDNTVDKSYNLNVLVGDDEYHCENQICILDMPRTDNVGITIKYWSEYSGIVPLIHSFKMRNIILSDDGNTHSFALLGDEWPSTVDVCANAWDMFPETDSLESAWLSKIDAPDELETDLDYSLLAGRLIWNGYVDASGCPDSGLLPNGSADECGMTKAHDLVMEWQNRFNQVITRASEETYVPARLIKGVIAQESQFWPLWPNKPEYGYGMMSEMGIDLLLNWNVNYYLNLCKQYYTADQCQNGYSYLTDEQRRFLRGVCLLSVGTDEEFVLLANMLKASCAQTRQLIKNITGKEPEDVFSYETLWRISLGIYNTGSGCMGEAITYAWHENKREMSWTDFNKHIPEYCETARTYFDKVVYYGSTGLHPAQ